MTRTRLLGFSVMFMALATVGVVVTYLHNVDLSAFRDHIGEQVTSYRLAARTGRNQTCRTYQ